MWYFHLSFEFLQTIQMYCIYLLTSFFVCGFASHRFNYFILRFVQEAFDDELYTMPRENIVIFTFTFSLYFDLNFYFQLVK